MAKKMVKNKKDNIAPRYIRLIEFMIANGAVTSLQIIRGINTVTPSKVVSEAKAFLRENKSKVQVVDWWTRTSTGKYVKLYAISDGERVICNG